MFRIWGKLIKDNHLIKDTTICDESNSTRTQKVFHALEESNIKEFQRHAKTRFRQDSFMEEVDFDYLEFHIIEEDSLW